MRETKQRLGRCHPNYLMNVAHAYIVANNPNIKDTPWLRIAERGVKAWEDEAWSACANYDDKEFYEEVDVVILSYSRTITAAYKRWENEIKLAHLRFDQNEKRLSKSVTNRAMIAAMKWLVKLGLVAGLGAAVALLMDRFVPHKVTEVTGIHLPVAIGALSASVISVVVGTIWNNKQWSAAAAQLQWCLGAAEEELERASIEAFDLHWFQLCEAFQSYTGLDYTAEPSFISIMRNKLRARERWNKKLMFKLTSNVRVGAELVRRIVTRRSHSKAATAQGTAK